MYISEVLCFFSFLVIFSGFILFFLACAGAGFQKEALSCAPPASTETETSDPSLFPSEH